MKDIIESIIRKSLSEEQEAVAAYLERKTRLEEYAKYDDLDLTKKLQPFIVTLEDIINEEKVHIGQLTEMLNLFDINFRFENKGKDEAKKDIKETL